VSISVREEVASRTDLTLGLVLMLGEGGKGGRESSWRGFYTLGSSGQGVNELLCIPGDSGVGLIIWW